MLINLDLFQPYTDNKEIVLPISTLLLRTQLEIEPFKEIMSFP